MRKHPDPRAHSTEHILNQTMVRMYACRRCFTAHLGPKKSRCYFYFDHALTQGEVDEIQARVNQVIASDLPVSESFVSRDTARRLYDTDKLPEGVGDHIRIVHIGDYDACPCIGEHVAFTKDIGTFTVTTTSFENGELRIRFKLNRPPSMRGPSPNK